MDVAIKQKKLYKKMIGNSKNNKKNIFSIKYFVM